MVNDRSGYHHPMSDNFECNFRVFMFIVFLRACVVPFRRTASLHIPAFGHFSLCTLRTFSIKCRVFFINIAGPPRIKPAAPIRLATTDQLRNQQRRRAIHKKDGRDAANELRGQP